MIYGKFFVRELRTGEFNFLIISIILAVSCMTSVGFLINRITLGLEQFTGTLVGGDQFISSQDPVSQDIIELSKKHHLQTTQTVIFYTMLGGEQGFQLSAIKAVGNNYPLRGKIKVKDQNQNIVLEATTGPSSGEIWVEERVSVLLGVELGDDLSIGYTELKLTKILDSEPDLARESFTFAPKALVNEQDLDAMKVLQVGSRAKYKQLFSGDQKDLKIFSEEVKELLLPGQELKKSAEAQTRIKRALERSQGYLNLATTINLLLSAIVMIFVTYQYSQKKAKLVALLRCMGASSKKVFALFSIALLMLGVLFGLIGTGVGYIFQMILTEVLTSEMNVMLPAPGWSIWGLGVLIALVLIIGFALPGLWPFLKVSPIKVLTHQNIEREQSISYTIFCIPITILVLALLYKTQNPILLSSILIGFVLLFAMVYAFMDALSVIFRFGVKNISPVIKISMTQLVRNYGMTLVQITMFSLIIFLGLLIFLVKDRVLLEWSQQIPKEVPNYFMININQDNVPGIKSALNEQNIEVSVLYPLVRGRLVAINGEPVNGPEEDDPNKRRGFHRPLNLTWTPELPEDNHIVAGEWFSEQATRGISVEENVAQRLQVSLGDSLTFNIQDTEVTEKIVSIRKVNWSSFKPNFYIIYAKGILDQFGKTYMNSFHTKGDDVFLKDIIQKFPEISLISIEDILEQISQVFSMLSSIVIFLWQFTLGLGILLLLITVKVSINEKKYQAALFSVLGSGPRSISKIFAVEYIVIGMIAGGLAGLTAILVSNHILEVVLQIPTHITFNFKLIILSVLLGIGTITSIGLLSLQKVFKVRPLLVLKSG